MKHEAIVQRAAILGELRYHLKSQASKAFSSAST